MQAALQGRSMSGELFGHVWHTAFGGEPTALLPRCRFADSVDLARKLCGILRDVTLKNDRLYRIGVWRPPLATLVSMVRAALA